MHARGLDARISRDESENASVNSGVTALSLPPRSLLFSLLSILPPRLPSFFSFSFFR